MVKRGDIVLVSLDPVKGSEQGKTRPAVIIQHDSLNKHSKTTIIVPISSTIYDKNYSMHVLLNEFEIKGTIKVEHIRSIDKTRIIKKIGYVSDSVLSKIGFALQNVCDFY